MRSRSVFKRKLHATCNRPSLVAIAGKPIIHISVSPLGYHDVGVDSVTRDRARPHYDFNTDKVCSSLRIPKNSGFNRHMRNKALELPRNTGHHLVILATDCRFIKTSWPASSFENLFWSHELNARLIKNVMALPQTVGFKAKAVVKFPHSPILHYAFSTWTEKTMTKTIHFH